MDTIFTGSRTLNRFLLAIGSWLLAWIVGFLILPVGFQYFGFLFGIGIAYVTLVLLVPHAPREKIIYHWTNLLEPFNFFLILIVVGLHVIVQISIWGFPVEIHLGIFGIIMVAHFLTIIVPAITKPPKPTQSKIRTRRKKTWYDRIFGSTHHTPDAWT